MYLYDTETCCTALELGSFDDYDTYEGFKRDLKESIEDFNEREFQEEIEWGDKGYPVHTRAMIISFTNDRQENETKYLTELGFQSTEFVKKGKHPETKVAMHWIFVRDLLPALGLEFNK